MAEFVEAGDIAIGDIILVAVFGGEVADYLVLPENRLLSVAVLGTEGIELLPQLIAFVGGAKELHQADVIGNVDISGNTELLCSLWKIMPAWAETLDVLPTTRKMKADELRRKAREWWHSVSE